MPPEYMGPQNQPPHPDQPVIDITAEPSHDPYDSGNHPVSLERALRRRRKVFFLILFFLSAAAVIWLWTQPKVYQATATVLLTRIGRDSRPVTESEIASEIELIWSQTPSLGRIAAGAAGTLSESAQASDARRVELRRRIGVSQISKSQILGISFTDSSARFATDQANHLTGLYLGQRQSLFTKPMHMVAVEAEAAALGVQAENARKELSEFDARSKGIPLGESFKVKSQRLATIEDRAFELKASVRGQEEVVRVLRNAATAQASAEVLRNEAQLAGMRAKLQETEKEFTRLERLETQAGTMAAKRDELARKSALAIERAEFVNRRLQENRIGGMNLQARLISTAEVKLVRTLDFDWLQILLLALAILATAWIGAWALDVFDRPVYSDDEFARMTGAPAIKTATH